MTKREAADVLVVETWISRDGLQAAKAEFDRGGYRYVVAAGGITRDDWHHREWNSAEVARDELVRLGLPKTAVIAAQAQASERNRTYVTALAASRELAARGIVPKAINVFTMGAHSRRSRLIFSRTISPAINVGAISWTPSWYPPGPWWKSSRRAEMLLKETVGWLFEAVFGVGSSRASSTEPKRSS